MDDGTATVVRQWLGKAGNDLLNIRNNFAAEHIPTDTICFHAQQAIEKLLKATLIGHGRNVTKTHDLVKLLSDVSDVAPELLPYEEHLEEISEYGVAARYPDDFYEPGHEEAQRAFEVALDIEAIVRKHLSF